MVRCVLQIDLPDRVVSNPRTRAVAAAFEMDLARTPRSNSAEPQAGRDGSKGRSPRLRANSAEPQAGRRGSREASPVLCANIAEPQAGRNGSKGRSPRLRANNAEPQAGSDACKGMWRNRRDNCGDESSSPSRFTVLDPTEISLAPGELAYLIGPSGSGKTAVLRALRGRWPGPVVAGCLGGSADATGRAVLDLFDGPTEATLRLLCLAGLAEPRLWFAPARCLSAGQADRLGLALLFARAEREKTRRRGEGATRREERTAGRGDAGTRGGGEEMTPGRGDAGTPGEREETRRGREDATRRERKSRPVLLLIDEFGSRLDRVTAAVLARNLRRWLGRQCGDPLSLSLPRRGRGNAGNPLFLTPSSSRRGRGGSTVSVVVATAHDDLAEPLAPDWVWVKTSDGGLRVLRGAGCCGETD